MYAIYIYYIYIYLRVRVNVLSCFVVSRNSRVLQGNQKAIVCHGMNAERNGKSKQPEKPCFQKPLHGLPRLFRS